jgi:NADH:ubiquinone oxidoreductase subunit D
LQFRRGCCNAAGDVGAKPFEWVLADVSAILGSLDIVFGEIDR